MTTRANRGLWIISALLSTGIAIYAYRYFLTVGPHAQLLDNRYGWPFLYVHIIGAATALLIGPLNLIPVIRRRWPQAHRWIGRIYVVSCLIGGAGGLVVAFGSTAGPPVAAGFGLLAVGWIAANVQGWRMARARRFVDHQAWMILSFAMTCAAVTLRLYMPLLPPLHIPILEGYRAISFLCWVPNLVVAELYIRGMFSGMLGPTRRVTAER